MGYERERAGGGSLLLIYMMICFLRFAARNPQFSITFVKCISVPICGMGHEGEGGVGY